MAALDRKRDGLNVPESQATIHRMFISPSGRCAQSKQWITAGVEHIFQRTRTWIPGYRKYELENCWLTTDLIVKRTLYLVLVSSVSKSL